MKLLFKMLLSLGVPAPCVAVVSQSFPTGSELELLTSDEQADREEQPSAQQAPFNSAYIYTICWKL